jgi:hypothetical protein
MTGGDIIEIRYKHPTLGDGVFYPKSGEAFTFDPGGFISADDDAGIAGNGEMIDIMTQKRWSLEGVTSWDMNGRNDLATLRLLESNPLLADWTWSSINGTVWGGKGKPVGGNSGDKGAATFTLKIAGGGKATKIIG